MENLSNPDATGGIIAMIMSMMVFIVIIMVFFIICQWRIFTKAGKPGWASIIPIYNTIVMLEIVKKPVWWIILLLIPGVNLIFAIILIHNLSKVFGQGTGFTLGLLFLSFIFYPMLAFGNYKYIGDGTNEEVPAFA